MNNKKIEIKMEIPKKLYNFLDRYCAFTEKNIDDLLRNIMRWGFESFFSIIAGSYPLSEQTLEQKFLNDF